MRLILFVVSAIIFQLAGAQAMYFSSATKPDDKVRVVTYDDREEIDKNPWLRRGKYASFADSVVAEVYAPDTVISLAPLPRDFFMPSVYDTYVFFDSVSDFAPDFSGKPELRWVEDANANALRIKKMRQTMAFNHPEAMIYNVAFFPDPIEKFDVVINPEEHTVEVREAPKEVHVGTTFGAEEIKKRHWIKNFSASLQFSQAYVSPNWYQGGNSNVNALANIYYNVKLNQKYHPKLIFESTFQYKLGINSAPNDTVRSYNISDDLLQLNTLFGYKAFDKWYYSVTGQFRTQLVNAYSSNSHTLRSAFLSPGELNIGLGMTYNTKNAKGTFAFDASISPLSYNLKICRNSSMDPGAYGIKEGHHTVSNYGSSLEGKLSWRMSYNILLTSRLFAFTDYERFYSDWENVVTFEINKFLITQLFLNLRYDTDTPKVPDQDWSKLQLKELLTIGITYRFSTT